jgi:hypothetical protein
VFRCTPLLAIYAFACTCQLLCKCLDSSHTTYVSQKYSCHGIQGLQVGSGVIVCVHALKRKHAPHHLGLHVTKSLFPQSCTTLKELARSVGYHPAQPSMLLGYKGEHEARLPVR